MVSTIQTLPQKSLSQEKMLKMKEPKDKMKLKEDLLGN